MQIIAVVFGECHTILLAFYFYHSEKVERWNGGKVPPKQNTPDLKTVSSRADGVPSGVADPGSSLLETSTQSQNRTP
jgi:hypothetical protein